MKAVLVVEMPNECGECILQQCGFCLYNFEAVDRAEKPNWCPLRPLPEQMLWGHTVDYIEGYNACLDEIGETE